MAEIALAAPPTTSDPLVQRVGPFLNTYCVDCHSGGDDAEAGVDLEAGVSLNAALGNPARWRQVRGLIELHAMPPSDYDAQPTTEERLAAAAAIDELLNHVDCTVEPDPGRVTMRRLNAAEYDNTVRALLGVDFQASSFAGFPEDSIGNGFDNQGEVLTFSPLLLERYLDAAEEITRRTIVLDRETLRERRRTGGKLFADKTLEFPFWLGAGEYSVEFSPRFARKRKDGRLRVEVLVDGRAIGVNTINNKWQRLRFAVDGPARERTVVIRLIENKDPGDATPGEAASNNVERREEGGKNDDKKASNPSVYVSELLVWGPIGGVPAYPEQHTNLIIATPGDGLSVREAARQNFARLLPKAFRRPVTPNQVERHADLVVAAVEQGRSFERGMALGVQAVLVSPHFLFHVEQPSDGGGPKPLDDFELANRLSFFLWASMPDDTLLEQAERRQLRQPKRLREAARRLLDAPEADAFAERFFGQWFGLGAFDFAAPDSEQQPLWNDRLRNAMREETLRLIRYVLREDRSLFELLDADYTFLNPRLAEFYGVAYRASDPYQLYLEGPGVPFKRAERTDRSGEYLHEDEWIRAPAPAGRRGVLTHAALLTLTSNPRETSPVKRGKWVLETVLGEPPPPAPPSVPPLEETAADMHTKPIREQLARHREDPGCAACHQQMDPIGLALENFDPIGRWRDTDTHGNRVDPSGELDGDAFGGPLELIALVRKREETIARNFASKLLVYAIGRGLTPGDRCAVDLIVEQAKTDGYRLSSFIAGVVTSKPFRLHGSGKQTKLTENAPPSGEVSSKSPPPSGRG